MKTQNNDPMLSVNSPKFKLLERLRELDNKTYSENARIRNMLDRDSAEKKDILEELKAKFGWTR